MNVAVTNAAEGLSRRAFTVADVERMVEVGLIHPDERLEIIGGEIVPMSPKGSRHEQVKIVINRHWGRACPDHLTFAQEPGFRLSTDTYLEPDFIIFPASLRIASVQGTDVLLAIEVADSSLHYDLHRKPSIYAAFGVRELWVIDVAKRVTHILWEPAAEGFRSRSTVPASERLVPHFAPEEMAFTLDQLSPD